jgi:hypothetical protein
MYKDFIFPFITPHDHFFWLIFDVCVTTIVYRIMVERAKTKHVNQDWLNGLFLGLQAFFVLATYDFVVFFVCVGIYLWVSTQSEEAIQKNNWKRSDEEAREIKARKEAREIEAKIVKN